MKKLFVLLLCNLIFSLSVFAAEYIAFQSPEDGGIYSLAVPQGITAEEYAIAYSESHPGIHAVVDDERHLMEIPTDPLYAGVQMAYDLMHLKEAWELLPHQQVGKTVVVAVIDSGCNVYHEDLKDRVLTGYNVVFESTDVVDNFNHGTAVCGLVAAAANELGSVGTAGGFDVKILPINVVKQNGDIFSSHVAKAITYAVEQGVDVINISIGGVDENALEKAAIEKAIAAGIIIVSAAGNENGSSYYYPACYDNCISVGSCNALGKIAESSVHNDKVTVTAPGSYITSTSSLGNDMYGTTYNGTSFASPMVAGVCAMLKAVCPELTAEQAKAVLSRTATDAGDTGRDDYYGHGYVHAEKALLDVLSLSKEKALAANAILAQARELVPMEGGMGVHISLSEADTIAALVVWETYDASGALTDRKLFFRTQGAASKNFLVSPKTKTAKLYIWTDLHPLCKPREFETEVTNEN